MQSILRQLQINRIIIRNGRIRHFRCGHTINTLALIEMITIMVDGEEEEEEENH